MCYEDQMRINLFARKNIHLCELKEQVEEKGVRISICKSIFSVFI